MQPIKETLLQKIKGLLKYGRMRHVLNPMNNKPMSTSEARRDYIDYADDETVEYEVKMDGLRRRLVCMIDSAGCKNSEAVDSISDTRLFYIANALRVDTNIVRVLKHQMGICQCM